MVPSLIWPEALSQARPLGFAHRGAGRSKKEHNTLAAFERALALGARGLESDIAQTRDGVPILAHPRLFERGPRLASLRRDELPAHTPSLHELYRRCGNNFDLALDMAQPAAADEVMRIAQQHGAADRLWLTYWHLSTLETWRRRWPHAHLVYPTVPLRPGGAIRLLDRLVEQQVTALNIHHRFCTARLVAQAHSRGLLIFAWGVRTRQPLARLMAHGIDGLFCDDVEGMVEVLGLSRFAG